MPTPKERIRREEPNFWEEAQDYLRKRNVTMASGCEQYLRDFVSKGEMRIQSERLSEEVSDEIRANLFRFIDEMITEKEARGYAELHEDTFFAAVSRLCPLFPFC